LFLLEYGKKGDLSSYVVKLILEKLVMDASPKDLE
jgi:hypothetical protein